jgi:hypothetical protein
MEQTVLATDQISSRPGIGFRYMAIVVLALVALIYWPVHQAWFVWDDKIFLRDNAWLWAGNDWRTVVLHGLPDWHNYFRPLGMALWVLEVRGFGVVPGPMHVLSLLLHLTNTLLVGLIALRFCRLDGPGRPSNRLACVAMLIYGLHPALIEPVSWIASQCDLLVTLFMLLGLLLNLTVRRTAMRAVLVATSFFVATSAKESAIAFPVLLFLFDWAQSDGGPQALGNRHHFLAIIRRQGPIYSAVLIAGIGYLIFRDWALVHFLQPIINIPFLSWQRFQIVCFTYLVYWRMIIWPFVGLSPIHIVPTARFAIATPVSLGLDMAAVAVGLTGLWLAWRRQRLGIIIVAVTAALFSALHVIPIEFDESLFHERYTMPAIAVVCVLLPGMFAVGDISVTANRPRLMFPGLIGLITLWLLLATLNIRITLPLWFNDMSMWQWAARENPDTVFVQDHVLEQYIDTNDLVHATSVANFLMSKGQSCPSCMLDVASLAIVENNVALGAEAMKKADAAMAGTIPGPTLVVEYVLENGALHQIEHDDDGAEAAYRDAISMDSKRPAGYMALAILLARHGKSQEANSMLNKALALYPPDVIELRRSQFRQALAQGARLSSQH